MDNRQRKQKGRHYDSTTQYDASPTRQNDDGIFSRIPSMSVPSSPAFHRSYTLPTPYEPPPTFSSYEMPLHPESYNMPVGSSSHYGLLNSYSPHGFPDTSNLYPPNVEGSSSHPIDPMNPFWNLQVQQHHSNYDRSGQFTSGMDLAGTTLSSQPEYRHGVPQQALSAVPVRVSPFPEEIKARNGKYNAYAWQRKFTEEDLVDIYLRIGAHWPVLPRATFLTAWNNLNQLLDENLAYVLLIQENKEKRAIKDLSKLVLPSSNTPSLTYRQDPEMTMAKYLSRRSSKEVLNPPQDPRQMLLEETLSTQQGDAGPSWVPQHWDKKHTTAFIKKLGKLWKQQTSVVLKLLTQYKPEAIDIWSPFILDSNETVARGAATRLIETSSSCSQQSASHSDDDPNFIGQGHGQHHQLETIAEQHAFTGQNEETPTWASPHMDSNYQRELVGRLGFAWKLHSIGKVKARLNNYGRLAVAKYAERIMGNDMQDVERAAKQLTQSYNHGNKVKAGHRKEYEEHLRYMKQGRQQREGSHHNPQLQYEDQYENADQQDLHGGEDAEEAPPLSIEEELKRYHDISKRHEERYQ